MAEICLKMHVIIRIIKILVRITFFFMAWFVLIEALIRPSGSSVNSAIYIKECLEKRLLPFIVEFHIDGNYIFWPDLASAHYSNETQAWLRGKVKYVPKHLNPSKCPKRPIENFWGCLAQKVYEGGWEAKTEQRLIDRIHRKLREFDLKSVEYLMRGVKAKVKSIGQHWVFSLFKKWILFINKFFTK